MAAQPVRVASRLVGCNQETLIRWKGRSGKSTRLSVKFGVSCDRASAGLETLGPIFEERAFSIETAPPGGTTIIDGGNSDDFVADWFPRDIHGVLDNGREVSVIGARGGMTDPSASYPPQYRQRFGTIRHIIHDAHVDRGHVFCACRFRLTGPNWLRHADGHADTADGGRLGSLNDGSSQWFEFTPAEPMSVLDYDRAVLHPIETLATLLTSHRAEAVELAVRQSPGRPLATGTPI